MAAAEVASESRDGDPITGPQVGRQLLVVRFPEGVQMGDQEQLPIACAVSALPESRIL
jgi:hypothetical protein